MCGLALSPICFFWMHSWLNEDFYLVASCYFSFSFSIHSHLQSPGPWYYDDEDFTLSYCHSHCGCSYKNKWSWWWQVRDFTFILFQKGKDEQHFQKGYHLCPRV